MLFHVNARPSNSASRTHQLRRRRVLSAAATAGVLAALVAPGTSYAAADGPSRVAAGLDNPRQLSFAPNGDLFVAESGRGGEGPCFGGAEGEVCFGTSGAVTRIRAGGATKRVLTGLPSLASPEDGSGAIGPAGIDATGEGVLLVATGLGAPPNTRDEIPGGAKLGTLLRATVGSNATTVMADLAAHEGRTNPIADPDSNPSGVVGLGGGGALVTDAGGNTLVRVWPGGGTKTIAVFPNQMATEPPIPAQAVPTQVVRGDDRAYYVSQLTGFPFEKGLAKIYRVVPGEEPTVYASGLTNVTSLAWARHGLYAVQLADDGLLNGPSGSLVRIQKGGKVVTVADNLFAPYGLATRGGAAYVSTCSVCAGGGEVWRYPLG